ncbi:MAG: AAA family ATPase [Oscillospiraceae bacterium]|nr:AAA family ATPase [Oscillospiraceae bacterium]
MSMIKIHTLELENVKRIKAVQIAPAENGLTVIGGNNRQGKTSVLDAICWALGGDRYKPSQPQREGSEIPPHLRITLSNGLIVERSGKNSALKVIDPDGRKGGQQLLNEFVEQFALDLPAFMAMTDKKKADVLLRIIGIGEQLYTMEQNEQQLYNRRLEIGRIADQKTKYAAEMPLYTDVPKEPVSAAELIAQQQEILARNGQRQQWQRDIQSIDIAIQNVTAEIARTEQTLADLRAQLAQWQEKAEAASKTPEVLAMESTAELEEQLREVETVNAKVRANCDREKAELDADDFRRQYDALSEELDAARAARHKLLDGAQMPLAGLSVENGALIYNGQAWDNMSGADQMIVAASIVRKLNPNCGFVLLDKLEQMDMQTLTAFGKWLEAEGLQAIATRVSTGGECSVLIEDGYSVTPQKEEQTEPKSWKAGEF